MSNITMKEVAVRAGVSLATVSHVINGTRYVSKETTERVMSAIKDLSYVPNVAARSFKMGKRYMIGFIIPNIANNFYSTIIEEIETVISKRGYSLLLSNTKESPERELNAIHTLSSGMVDGLILASTHQNYHEIKPAIPDHFPVICVDRVLEDNEADVVGISSQDALYDAAKTLLECGHKKLGFIAFSNIRSPNMERLENFKKAIDKLGFPMENVHIEYALTGTNHVFQLADHLYQNGVTGILAANNLITLDLIRWSMDRHLTLKKDVDIIGYYAEELFPEMLNISSIHMPTSNMGELAGELMLHRLQHPNAPIVNHVLHSNFILR